ncbi:MAG: hypothetical protein BLM47_13135 [Candidatus Reconcilbacillus cellulovorans]|uniref:Uncharacterized protein n=1 Tax=Candidatus Reconcilbacillus cellulovorans TaxID=1906605 RepID=A0A2A6DX64_9BACL|nr:MAG: hypothetical protein BLM47_13135 [Candidatus Reconcilbacillus cellulovorans]
MMEIVRKRKEDSGSIPHQAPELAEERFGEKRDLPRVDEVEVFEAFGGCLPATRSWPTSRRAKRPGDRPDRDFGVDAYGGAPLRKWTSGPAGAGR